MQIRRNSGLAGMGDQEHVVHSACRHTAIKAERCSVWRCPHKSGVQLQLPHRLQHSLLYPIRHQCPIPSQEQGRVAPCRAV